MIKTYCSLNLKNAEFGWNLMFNVVIQRQELLKTATYACFCGNCNKRYRMMQEVLFF